MHSPGRSKSIATTLLLAALVPLIEMMWWLRG
jgi:hypothetical protein